MTKIVDDPETFASAALAGFSRVYGRYVRLVKGGVVRATAVPRGKVSVIVGGGSGHYPAFAGYVGPGMADAAVAGEIFASPSTAAVARVCRKADFGGGILLGFGNYAGDVLNFGVAAERLRAEGIDVRIVTVTDDVASAPADRHLQRRGIAGDFLVFKVAGAAAEAGLSLNEVERVTRLANARTFSFGVAFGGCTLPGATAPLFTVSKGMMALGLGIHGEPGIRDTQIVPAGDLATLLVDTVLAERPAGARRAAVLLNGLGATKYEELFVLWGAVEGRLAAAGVDLVAPEAGEYVTSLDMQGCSLTVMWLDEELERFWLAPCDTPVFRRGEGFQTQPAAFVEDAGDETPAVGPASGASRESARCLAGILEAMVSALEEAEAELGRIDAFAGDGDHGQGMRRGAAAARDAIHQAVVRGAGAKTALAVAGDAWADRAGGTSGAIWGLLLRSWSSAFSDEKALPEADIVRGARLALDDVMRLGGAKPGDKTLVDAFVPFVAALETARADGLSLKDAWRKASVTCEEAAQATAPLSPRLGRARPLAERSIGHPDAGAVSLALVARTIASRL
ncbi:MULTISPECIES: dihydroxyacetone kinase family protein [unclassified Shinella]|uniref:dihydroxyacetone kinase family protein n=1 Tax=unclassified Shinella TaxID=2643062 RepID=UPI00225C4B5D|nr:MULTISPECIES: dihydroxyacetone kinase family protein [unclassified Shinella]MCO5140639.1 dihydroxyacetone kinase family protein [Shinella sp.]MDC7256671.1 dihydroxyacetone kinase family protein [Shinella sp. YE25]CAI0339549.1 D-erythrulose kinase [Rhizobiaceae bacterium]CAK7257945.1 D-erythrulose kinase [Shinella sp. WSC3-e]